VDIIKKYPVKLLIEERKKSSYMARNKGIENAKGEIIAIKEKAERFIESQSTTAGLRASTPMLTSIASELGFLSEDQAIALRRAVTFDMEMRKEESKEKAKLAVKVCEDALILLSKK